MSRFLKYEDSSETSDGQLVTLPDGPSIHTSFDTFALESTLNSSRIEISSATAYTFAVLQTSNATTAANKTVRALECKIDFCTQLIRAEMINNVYNETILQQTTKHRLYERKASERTSLDDYLEFQSLPGVNTTDNLPISLDKGQPGCLGGLLNFDQREVVALTELGLDGIEDMVENMSLSASRIIRTVCDGGVRHPGMTWQTVALVRVTWLWLLLPVIVEALGIAFFCSVATFSKNNGMTIWKSSLTAALYHSLDSNELDNIQELEGLYDMEQVAEKMKVTLIKEDDASRSRLLASVPRGIVASR